MSAGNRERAWKITALVAIGLLIVCLLVTAALLTRDAERAGDTTGDAATGQPEIDWSKMGWWEVDWSQTEKHWQDIDWSHVSLEEYFEPLAAELGAAPDEIRVLERGFLGNEATDAFAPSMKYSAEEYALLLLDYSQNPSQMMGKNLPNVP